MTEDRQVRADRLIMGLMRRDRRSLEAIIKDIALIDVRSSLGLSPLFAACYTLWPEACRRLLDAGADPAEVGLGSALDAVALGVRDAGRCERAKEKGQQIVEMLISRRQLLAKAA
jgi:hypothetical protein